MLLLLSLRFKLHPTDLHVDAGFLGTRFYAELLNLHSPLLRAEARFDLFKRKRPIRGSMLAQNDLSCEKGLTQPMQQLALNLIHNLATI